MNYRYSLRAAGITYRRTTPQLASHVVLFVSSGRPIFTLARGIDHAIALAADREDGRQRSAPRRLVGIFPIFSGELQADVERLLAGESLDRHDVERRAQDACQASAANGEAPVRRSIIDPLALSSVA